MFLSNKMFCFITSAKEVFFHLRPFVCWFVSRLHKNYWTHFHKNWMEEGSRDKTFPWTFVRIQIKGRIQKCFLTFFLTLNDWAFSGHDEIKKNVFIDVAAIYEWVQRGTGTFEGYFSSIFFGIYPFFTVVKTVSFSTCHLQKWPYTYFIIRLKHYYSNYSRSTSLSYQQL